MTVLHLYQIDKLRFDMKQAIYTRRWNMIKFDSNVSSDGCCGGRGCC